MRTDGCNCERVRMFGGTRKRALAIDYERRSLKMSSKSRKWLKTAQNGGVGHKNSGYCSKIGPSGRKWPKTRALVDTARSTRGSSLN